MKERKPIDGIIGPVFQKASEVDWEEVEEEWEELTGRKLKYSWWRGFLLWLLLVGVFAYLQAAFFNLYFSRPYLEKKVSQVALLAKEENLKDFDFQKIERLKANFLDLKGEVDKKGQFFVFLSFNPLFEDEVLDLSRILLAIERINSLENLASRNVKKGPETFWRFKFYLWIAKSYIKDIRKALSLTKEPSIRGYSLLANAKLKELENYLKGIDKNLKELLWLSGQIEPKRYLLLFANNKEERNWGGYTGTYGELQIDKDKINFFLKDIYYLDWLVRKDNVFNPPKPKEADSIPSGLASGLDVFLEAFKKVMPEDKYIWWFLRNAPISLDFKTNAQRASWFYEKIHKQGKVDGVILLTPDFVLDILKIIGPIEMSSYGVTISSQNFRDVIEYKVEIDNPFKRGDRTQSPKQILSDLAPLFLERVKNTSLENKKKIFEAILKNLKEKQIIAYFDNAQVEEIIEAYNFGGTLRDYPYDYLSLYTSNFNGRKCSLNIERNITISSVLTESGKIKDTLSIEFFYKENPSLFGGRGDFLVQIALPNDVSIKKMLRNGEDFNEDIIFSEEKNKKVLLFPMHLEPFGRINFQFEYELEEKINDRWGLLFQKQPGIEEINFQYNFSSSKAFRAPGGVNRKTILRKDEEFQIFF